MAHPQRCQSLSEAEVAGAARLLVGLGNPGPSYARHRHNIGFMALDAVHAAHGGTDWQKKYQGLLASAQVAGEKIWLLKPQTFMNLSGQSVQAAAGFLQISPQNIFVVHDEIELLPGRVRIKQGGGHAGHNGLKSIDSTIGANYWRVRLGVGRPVVAEEVADYVLQNFGAAERIWVEKICATLAAELPALWGGSVAQAALLNKLTQALAPPKAAKPTVAITKPLAER